VTQLRAGYAKRVAQAKLPRAGPFLSVQNTCGALWQCPRPATPHAFPLSSKLTLSSQSPFPITVYGVTGIPSYAIIAMRIALDCEGDPFNRVKNSSIPFFQGYVSLHVIVAPSKQDTSPIEPSFSSGAAACVQVTRQHTKPRAPRSSKLRLGLCAVASLTSCRLIPSGQSNAHRQNFHSIHAYQCTPAVPPDW
jgi:hypothetical protein